MAMPSAPGVPALALLVFVPLVLWRVYARFRRLVGRQRLSKVRVAITLTVFPLLAAMLAFATLARPERLAWLAGGLAAGAILAIQGWKRTRLEPTPQGLYYTPNAHLGIALSLLFVGRILYRLVELYLAGSSPAPDFARSPPTLAIFGLLAGYYVGYAIALARWRSGLLARKKAREARAAG